ncbi:hypothetical protein BKA61DRAFT_261570 [Leptodontidium sp. MPI-SDFR-AT-0119]|nr:hypothetical protein BKA61DRAFT_261570 [Leptodontidium sp. MPI-SDFR-AT-0119]
MAKAIGDQRTITDKRSYNTLAYPSPESPVAFIKYGPEELGMREEWRNQEFAFEALEKLHPQERKGVHIPKIYRVIQREGMIYIVMEYVVGATLAELAKSSLEGEQQERYEQIAKAIRLFLAFEVTDQASPGPVGGGIIKHPLFEDAVASLRYNSAKDLQEHLTTVANSPNDNNLRVDFTGESFCFCFADLFEGNFIFTATSSLYIVDFHHASFLPTSFMTYALNQPRPVCAAIKDKFDLPTKNLAAMRVAGYYFMISSRQAGLRGGQNGQHNRGKRNRGVYATGTRRASELLKS